MAVPEQRPIIVEQLVAENQKLRLALQELLKRHQVSTKQYEELARNYQNLWAFVASQNL